MTPLIKQFVSSIPDDAVNHHWFDMSHCYRKSQNVSSELMSHPLPYPKVALVCGYENKRVLIFVCAEGDANMVTGLHSEGPRIEEIQSFFYLVDESGIRVKHADGTRYDYKNSAATGVIAFIAAFLESLETTPITGYQPVKPRNWAKKIRQGKVPRYEWKTVVIEPSKPKSAPQGGTHASPKWHERRGHWRTMKTGKKVWVRNCEVGDKKLGAVFKDYILEKPNEPTTSRAAGA